jgi:hypothetical protein
VIQPFIAAKNKNKNENKNKDAPRKTHSIWSNKNIVSWKMTWYFCWWRRGAMGHLQALTLVDEVQPRQCPCLRAFKTWRACGIRQTRRWSDDTENTGFTQVRPPWWVTTYVLLVWLYWWGGYNRCIQWWRRLDLAKEWRALEVTSTQVDGSEKCLARFLDLPPNLLYAKVGSQDYSPRQLHIEVVWINPRQVLIRLGLVLRVLHCMPSLAPGPR